MARRRLRARVNWATRWGGLALVALTAAVYVASSVWGFGFAYRRRGLDYAGGVWRGRLLVIRVENNPPGSGPLGWFFSVKRPAKITTSWAESLRWKFQSYRGGAVNQWDLYIPLWIVPVAVAPLCVPPWLMRKRARGENACPSCNYDLSGLPPGSPCPECAAKPPAPPDH